MRKSAARRFVESLERELALHREMLELIEGPSKAAAADAGVVPEPGLSESLLLAARLRDALASALPETGGGGALLELLESLPADEAARVAELRREFEGVLAALYRGGRERPGPGPLPA